MESIAPDWGRKDPKGKEKSPTILEDPDRHIQQQNGKKTKMPLKCWFVSLAVAYFTAKEFEVLQFPISWVCCRSSRVEI